MAYNGAGLSLGFDLIGGAYRVWVYKSDDPFSDVDDADYFDDAADRGMQEGDIVFVVDQDSNPPDVTLAYVSEIKASGSGTVSALGFAGAASFSSLAVTGDASLGSADSDKVGFYGATAVSQRAGAAQATSALATSSDFGPTQLAALVEVMDTLTALGLWKGEA